MKAGLKKKIVLILGAVLGICLIVCLVFAIRRPGYVQEAVQILFENEMNKPLPDEGPSEPEKIIVDYSDEVKHQGPGQTVPRTPDNTESSELSESSEESEED